MLQQEAADRKNIAGSAADREKYLNHEQLLAFQHSVRSGDTEELGAFFRGMREEAWSSGTVPMIQLASALLQKLSEEGLEESAVFSECLELLVGLSWDPSGEAVLAALADLSHRTARLLNETRRLRSKAGSLMDSVLRYINQNYGNDSLTLNSAAKELGFSAGYLGDYFKRTAGINFTDYVSQIRLEKARQLLADPSRRTYEVAFACGFSNAHYFSVVFKKYMGMTPTQYRERLQGEEPPKD